MRDFRTIYNNLKEQSGNYLLDADAVRAAKKEAPAYETPKVTVKEDVFPSTPLDDIDCSDIAVGDVNLKDLIISAVNTLIKDNEDQLYDENDPGIECTVQDILDYAGVNLDELFAEGDDALREAILATAEKEDGAVETFLERIITEVLTEFGERGWDVLLSDTVATAEDLMDIDEGVNVCRELYKFIGKGEAEEYEGDVMTSLRTLLISEKFADSAVLIKFEEDTEESEAEEDDDEDTLTEETAKPETQSVVEESLKEAYDRLAKCLEGFFADFYKDDAKDTKDYED